MSNANKNLTSSEVSSWKDKLSQNLTEIGELLVQSCNVSNDISDIVLSGDNTISAKWESFAAACNAAVRKLIEANQNLDKNIKKFIKAVEEAENKENQKLQASQTTLEQSASDIANIQI